LASCCEWSSPRISIRLTVIYNIDESISCKILKFADDTKLYARVNSINDINSLREDLCNLVTWSKDWQMLFNLYRYKVIHLGSQQSPC